MSPVGELQKSLRHLDKASLISGICDPFRGRHALGGIPTIFVCCIRQTYPASLMWPGPNNGLLLALRGHRLVHCTCLLSGAKRTSWLAVCSVR